MVGCIWFGLNSIRQTGMHRVKQVIPKPNFWGLKSVLKI